MKRVFGLFVVLMALGLRPAPAAAATITNLQFCDAAGNMGGVESSSCPAGLSAFLKIDTSPIGTNEYDVTLTLDSTLIDTSTFASIPQVQFTIGGVVGSDNPGFGNYQTTPTVDVSGLQGTNTGTWNTHFSNINNGAQCLGDKNNSQAVCSAAVTGGVVVAGTDTGNIDVWLFHLNLDDSLVNPITANSGFNLRAQFYTPTGANAGILSPNGVSIPAPGGGNDTPGTPGVTRVGPGDFPVPEPTSLLLLGSGLAYVSSRIRRRAQR